MTRVPCLHKDCKGKNVTFSNLAELAEHAEQEHGDTPRASHAETLEKYQDDEED